MKLLPVLKQPRVLGGRSLGGLFLVALMAPVPAIAAEPAWWTQQKQQCGLSPGLAYNTWVDQGSPCTGTGGGGLTPEQQFGMQMFGVGLNMLMEGLKGDPQAEARRQAEAQRQAEAKRQAEAEELRRQEDAKQRIFGSLKGAESSGELALKTDESASLGGLQLKTDSPSAPSSASHFDAFTKGFEDASQCYSQNAGPRCAGASAEQQQACISDYRSGYETGDKQRQQVMDEAYRTGQSAGAKSEPANADSDPRALGPCRTQWIEAYNQGYYKSRHTNTQH